MAVTANVPRTLTARVKRAKSFTGIISFDVTFNAHALLCARYYSLTFLYMRKQSLEEEINKTCPRSLQ